MKTIYIYPYKMYKFVAICGDTRVYSKDKDSAVAAVAAVADDLKTGSQRT